MSEIKEIFLSYSHVDSPTAERLVAVLEGYGFAVWWDHALLCGENYRTQIAERIRNARVVLALLSSHSVQSGWVLDEAGRASEAGKLIPVRIEEVEVPLGFGWLLRGDLVGWQNDPSASNLNEILLAVERLTGHPRSKFQLKTDVSGGSPRHHAPQRPDRFSIGWLPHEGIRSVMHTVLVVYLLALLVAIIAKEFQMRDAFREWVRLLHIYSGMIMFGGGIFLTLVFRLADRAPTALERAAVADVARPLLGGWRVAAFGQLVTGFLLIKLNSLNFQGWLVEGVLLYVFALYLWWTGFGHALRAAQYEALYQGGAQITEYRRMRDQNLFLALFVTAWVLVTMIYQKDMDITHLFSNVF
jgi:TIR domain/Predicted integral membrane protein (DUF2269)